MQKKSFNIYVNNNQAVQDAYAMLTANIHISKDKRPIKAIAVSSYKPGAGKTTLAINLSVTMAMSGWKVLLVDADIRKPKAAKRLNNELNYGLADYLAEEMELTDAICVTDVKNLHYLSCGENHPNPIGLLCSHRYADMLEVVRKEYDFIIFDTPALASVADGTTVAAKADATILVVEMGQETLVNVKRSKEMLEKSNVQVLGVVLNRVKRRDYKKYFESYNYFFNTKKFMNKGSAKF